uniref:Uncharacterized protein n=1 Tax=Arundo donax TaxID=35708 RepID=A0A0A9ETW3_ARUDO
MACARGEGECMWGEAGALRWVGPGVTAWYGERRVAGSASRGGVGGGGRRRRRRRPLAVARRGCFECGRVVEVGLSGGWLGS